MNGNMKVFLVAILSVTLFSSACSETVTMQPTYTPLPTYTAYPTYTLVLPTITPSSTNTLAPSATLTPTITRTPTKTPTSTLTPTITPTPTITITPTKTKRPTNTVAPSPTAQLREPWTMCPPSLIYGLGEDFTQVLCYTINSDWDAYGFVWYYDTSVVGIGIVMSGYCPISVDNQAVSFVTEAATKYRWNLQDMKPALDDIYSIPINKWVQYNTVKVYSYLVTTGHTFVVFYRAP
jgi:hypothetical protein